MLARCYNTKHRSYPQYGARGISVCERWRQSFATFAGDVGPKPKGRTLDRKDTNGNYEPDNCRWATPQQQGRNSRTVVWVMLDNERMTQTAAAAKLGVTHSAISYYVRKRGMSHQQAVDLLHRVKS
jgi:hypothetical protein